MLIPVILMIWIAVFPKMWKKAWEGRYTSISYKDLKLFSFLGICFVAVLLVFLVVFQARMYQKTLGAYENGNYMIVEGYVENYAPATDHDQGIKSFEVNGVKFSYAEHASQPGYNDAKSNGGVIIGDGQHLKIGYVYYNTTYGNVIVYIEQLS